MIKNQNDDEKQQEDEVKDDKNKGNQLDGAVMDFLNYWDNTKHMNLDDKDSWINS